MINFSGAKKMLVAWLMPVGASEPSVTRRAGTDAEGGAARDRIKLKINEVCVEGRVCKGFDGASVPLVAR